MQLRHDTGRRSPLRMALPVCPRCHDTLTAVSFRTASALYCRCPCGEVWSEQRTTGADKPQQKRSA